MTKWSSALIVLFGAASYGVLAIFVKIGYEQGFTVGEITGSQMFLGAIILWLIAFTQYKNWTKLSLRMIVNLLGVGSLSGFTGVLYYASLKTIPVTIAIVLLFQFVWVGVLYEWLLERTRPTKWKLISLLLILLGTFLAANILTEGVASLSWMGLLLGLCSAFTYAGFIYVSGKVSTEVSPWLRSPIMITGSFLVIFLIFPPTFLYSGALSKGLLTIALTIALFGAVIPTVCFTFGVPRTGVGLATILSSIELPVAVFMAWFILSEPVSLWQWLGVLLILLAIFLQRGKGKGLT